MRRIGFMAVLALALAGCGGGSGYQWGAPYGGGRDLPAARLNAVPGEVVPPGRDGDRALALRSFVPGPDGWQEVAGASCAVTGGHYFRAQVTTPVRLVLPDLGPDAPMLRADCATATARGAAVVAPYFPWPPETRASPLQRAWWGGGWWFGYQRSGPMRYPDLAVGLR